MSDYTELKGLKVRYLDSDPSPGTAGDVWYNTDSKQLKAFVASSAWHSGAPLSTGRYSSAGGGSQTAGIGAGGYTATAGVNNVEEYNGSGWTEVANLNTARGSLAGSSSGTSEAFLVFGGNPNTAVTELYDGSSWTEVGDLNTGKQYTSGAGTSTAALNAGRWGPPLIGNTEEFDGSSWTESGDLNTARGSSAMFGTQTAALFTGGNSGSPPNYRNIVEEYNGSSWTEVADMNTARGGQGGAGTTTSGLIFGGLTPGPANSVTVESWDGTSWTETTDLSTTGTRNGLGTASAALAFGTYPVTGTTEEWNVSISTVTAGAWASSGNMPVAIYSGASFGIQTSAVHSAGVPPANQADNNTYEYNGSTWSSGGGLPVNRQTIAGAGASETSGLAFCGRIPSNMQPSNTFHNESYEYDGSSWTSGGDYPATLTGVGGSGSQTAAIGAGGTSTAPGAPGMTNASATYDGSSWTAAPNTGTSATRFNMVGGTTTSAVSIANTPPFGCEEFDGSSWTTGGVPNHAGYSRNFTATSNSDALVCGGDATPRAQCESYNGTAWATSPNLGTGRSTIGTGRGVNPTATALAFGGYDPSGNSNSTEEFTAESSAATAKTIDFD